MILTQSTSDDVAKLQLTIFSNKWMNNSSIFITQHQCELEMRVWEWKKRRSIKNCLLFLCFVCMESIYIENKSCQINKINVVSITIIRQKKKILWFKSHNQYIYEGKEGRGKKENYEATNYFPLSLLFLFFLEK